MKIISWIYSKLPCFHNWEIIARSRVFEYNGQPFKWKCKKCEAVVTDIGWGITTYEEV